MVSFYIKRILRIYPVFIFAIIFSIFLKSFLFDATQMTSYSNWINLFWKWKCNEIPTNEIIKTLILIGPSFNKDLFDPVIGTLRTEMGMSLILPFFIIFALRFRLVINILICILFFIIGKDVFCMFFLGIIMAISHKKIIQYINQFNGYIVLILFFTSIIFYTSDFFLNIILPKRLIDALEILGGALFIILALKNGIFKNILNTTTIHFLGKISYSLYLLHLPILLVCLSLFSDMKYLVFPISLLTTILLSYLSYKYIEVFFITLGRKVKCNKANSVVDKYFFNLIKRFSFKNTSKL